MHFWCHLSPFTFLESNWTLFCLWVQLFHPADTNTHDANRFCLLYSSLSPCRYKHAWCKQILLSAFTSLTLQIQTCMMQTDFVFCIHLFHPVDTNTHDANRFCLLYSSLSPCRYKHAWCKQILLSAFTSLTLQIQTRMMQTDSVVCFHLSHCADTNTHDANRFCCLYSPLSPCRYKHAWCKQILFSVFTSLTLQIQTHMMLTDFVVCIHLSHPADTNAQYLSVHFLSVSYLT